MKERIVVENFSVIDSVEMEVKPITILIGPQASGKSVLAKLVYFFKDLPAEMGIAVNRDYTKRELDDLVREKFNKIFPQYLLKDKTFRVTYFYGDTSVTISNENAKTYKSWRVSYGNSVMSKFKALKKAHRRRISEADMIKSPDGTDYKTLIYKDWYLFFHGVERLFNAFVPAGRSYFVNVKENVFSHLIKGYDIDYMIAEFGAALEHFKAAYKQFGEEKFDEAAFKLFLEVLGGHYGFDGNNEWITMDDGRILMLKDASSGQQGVTPLALALVALTRMSVDRTYTFIEEPEAHLFPEFQEKIVRFLSVVYNALEKKAHFFITTHSPYILTFLNNCIQADNVRNELEALHELGKIDKVKKIERLEALEKLMMPNARISFDDISAYEVKEGTCRDIKNHEYRLIDATVIDDVSNSSAALFDQLLDIGFEE